MEVNLGPIRVDDFLWVPLPVEADPGYCDNTVPFLEEISTLSLIMKPVSLSFSNITIKNVHNLPMLSVLSLYNNTKKWYLHFTHVEGRSQRGSGICPKQHSSRWQILLLLLLLATVVIQQGKKHGKINYVCMNSILQWCLFLLFLAPWSLVNNRQSRI